MPSEEPSDQKKRAREADPLESGDRQIDTDADELSDADDPDSVHFFNKKRAKAHVADVMFKVKDRVDRRLNDMFEEDCNLVDIKLQSCEELASALRYIEVKKKGATCVEMIYTGPFVMRHNWPDMKLTHMESKTDKGGVLTVEINPGARTYSSRMMDVIRRHDFDLWV